MYKDAIKKIYIEPTSACNLNCKMCFRNNWINEEIGVMSDDTLNNVYMEKQRIYCFSKQGKKL